MYNAKVFFLSEILYIDILVDWSLSGIITSKLVIRESESPGPAASSILISRMTRSSVIIPSLTPNASSIHTRDTKYLSLL